MVSSCAGAAGGGDWREAAAAGDTRRGRPGDESAVRAAALRIRVAAAAAAWEVYHAAEEESRFAAEFVD